MILLLTWLLLAEDPLAAPLAEARALVEAGQPKAALDKLQTLGGGQDDARVQELVGVAAYRADDYARAVEALRSVVERLPDGSVEKREAVQVLGLSLYLSGHLAESIPLLEQTRVSGAASMELHHVLGMAYAQTRQPAKAREAFARVFGLPPDSGPARVLTAQMMMRVELEDMAEVELKAAIAQEPKLPRAHFLLGQLALFRGRLDESAALTREEIALNPGDAMALAQLGDALSRQQKWDEALEALQRSIWINPYYSAPYILLGKAYMKKREPGTAEAMLRRAIEYDPNNKAAHYLLGQLLQQTGRTAEAKAELDVAERLQGAPGR
jgi:tetratricopeptide (TPR) repeat protein